MITKQRVIAILATKDISYTLFKKAIDKLDIIYDNNRMWRHRSSDGKPLITSTDLGNAFDWGWDSDFRFWYNLFEAPTCSRYRYD